MRAAGLAHVALALSGVVGGAAWGNDELQRCAQISAADARLACYDALAARGRGAPATAPPPAVAASGDPLPSKPAAASAATTSPPSIAAPAAPVTATPVRTPVAGPAPAAADATSRFGLSPAQTRVEPTGPESIDAGVARVIESHAGQTTVVLDNGQMWLVRESGVRLSVGDKVTIRRAALGSYLLLTPSRYSYRASRTQ